MKKLLCGTVALGLMAAPASAMSYFTPSNVEVACILTQAALNTALANEQLLNQVAGKTVVRTGTTATIVGIAPTVCAQLKGAAAALGAVQAPAAK